MIKIYGSPKSSAGRCFWLLEELNLKYERMPIDMRAKEHKSENFLKLNPNGKVPCLIDDQFVIWESMAINNYLVDKYKSPLQGATPEDRGLISQWSFWAILELQKPLIEAFIQKVFVPEDRRDQLVIDNAINTTKPLLALLDKYLQNRKYMVGNNFSLADLNVASVVNLTSAIEMDIKSCTNVSSWAQSCQDRPAFQKVMQLN